MLPKRIGGQRPHRLPEGRAGVDCPVCGMWAPVTTSGRSTFVRCSAGCADDDVIEALRGGRKPSPPSNAVAPPDPEWGFNFTEEEIQAMREGRWP